MKIESKGVKIFRVFNVVILTALALLCLLPFLNVLALSFSDKIAAASGIVTFWPVNFTLDAYKYVIEQEAFWRSFLISIERVVLGGGLGIFLTVLCAYPLSKSSQVFKMDWLLMSIILLCIMAMVLYAVIGLLERLCRKVL